MEMIYAGTGSTRTPHWARDLFCIAGERLAESFTLRSGRQDGSDISFERGCEKDMANLKYGYRGNITITAKATRLWMLISIVIYVLQRIPTGIIYPQV